MTEYALAIGLSFATALLLRAFGLRSFERVVDALAQLTGGWRADMWPRGVQEEDPDRPWGRPSNAFARAPASVPEMKPPLTKVRPIVQSR
jgi:hypothetical protein